MYAEIETNSRPEIERFLLAQLDHGYANISLRKREGVFYRATISTDLEPSNAEQGTAQTIRSDQCAERRRTSLNRG